MDIDIDTKSDFSALDYFNVVSASMVKNGKLINHPAGVYFQNIPTDKISKLSAIPYKEAEKFGYFKFDFLHLNFLDNFNSKDEIRELLKIEPDWAILESQEHVEKLFQIHNHYDIVYKIRPTSVIALSDTIALIRPGKRQLLSAYLKHPNDIRRHLYIKPADGKYYFKKGHAISYALTIVLQLHLIKGNLL